MAQKTIRMVVEVTIRDMTRAERKECADMEGCKASELPKLNEVEMFDLAEVFAGQLTNNDEMWAGSMIYVKATDAKVTKCEVINT